MTATDEKTASISTEDKPSNMSRQLSGTAFLTLEHIGYFVLVTILPGALLLGVMAAMGLWAAQGGSEVMPLAIPNVIAPSVDTAGALGIVAILLVLVPLMYCLRRRVAAEYVKRLGYDGRVAYKLPVYTALGLLAAATIGMFITMLYVVLSSLALIGVSGVNIGEMYVTQFVPALLGFVVYGMAAWYVLWFAKGRDVSRLFVRIMGTLSAVVVIALFITAWTVSHDTKNRGNDGGPVQVLPYPLPNNRTYDF